MQLKKLLTKRSKSLLGTAFLAATSLATTSTYAQVDIQVGTGGGITSNLPITSCYGYSYSQQIYTSSEMTAGSITGPMEISKVRFKVSSTAWSGGNDSDDWVVYLGHTNKTSFEGNNDWIPLSDLTTNYTGTVSFPGGGSWLEITLDTPFQYDGNSNLVVAIDENAPNYNCSYYWNKSDLGSNRSIYVRDDYNNVDPANPPGANGRLNFVANLQFEATPAPDCSGSPAVVNLLSSEGTSLCIGDSTLLSVDTPPFESQISYQWQEYDGTTWNDLTGETSLSYQTSALNTTTDYRVVLTCGASSSSTPSSTTSLVINALPTVTVDNSSLMYCIGSSATITASGATTYEWTPSNGLDNTNTAIVNADPSSETSYLVTGTDANGCVNTATATVIPATEVNADLIITPGEVCAPGTPVTADITNLPTNGSGGTWSYRILEGDGLTEAQTWGASNTFTFTPTQDSVYNFFYQLGNSACTDVADSIPFEVVVGFGGEVNTINYNCNNMGGTISIEDVFAQTQVSTIYQNAFNATSDMTSVTMAGNANHNTRLELTPSQTSATGYAQVDIPNFQAGSNNSFSMTFDLTVDLPINNWGTGGADGIAYSFGANAEQSANGNGQNGKGNGLRISFDAAGNNTENNNTPGVYLVYGWTAGNAFGPGNSEVIAYSNNTSTWKGQTDIPVEFEINAAGKASISVNGVMLFENMDMPAAYKNADVSQWKHLFSAQTGGDAQRHAVSNLNIESSSALFAISQASATTVPTTWQSTSTFENLQPGTYHVWISKDQAGTCSRNIETVEVVNTNPVVDLGNDTTICIGETLTLDAQNIGATYTWSNMNDVSQTVVVDESGTFLAYVTDTNGCLGIGSINVDVMGLPTASDIYMQGVYPTMTFTAINPTNVARYDWDFGDQTEALNAPSTVDHTYTSGGNYVVTVELTNECGSTIVNELFNVLNTVGLEDESIEGLKVYPNPTRNQFTVELENTTNSMVTVYSVTGATVLNAKEFNGNVDIDVSNWERGVYMVTIENQGKFKTLKMMVQ